jgi:hypothetical protein
LTQGRFYQGTKYKGLQSANKELIDENKFLREQLAAPVPDPAAGRSTSAVPFTPALARETQSSLQKTLGAVTPSQVSPILPVDSHRSNRDTSGTTRTTKHRHSRRRRNDDYSSDSEEEEERRSERDTKRRPKGRREEAVRSDRRDHRSKGKGRSALPGKAKEELDDDEEHHTAQQAEDPIEALVQQIRERDDFVCLVESALKELHKACSQESATPLSEGQQRWGSGSFEFDRSNKHGSSTSSTTSHAREHARPLSYSFSALSPPRKSSSLALRIRLPPSARDFDRLSVALTEQKLAMEESFLLLTSLMRKKDATHQGERERLQQVVSKYKCEVNSLKMQLKHVKAFQQRGGPMSRTRSVEAMLCRGDESDDEFDDGASGVWKTRSGEEDVATIFNRLKSKLRKERADQDFLQRSYDEEEDRNNQELLWALKEVQVRLKCTQLVCNTGW